MTQEVLKRILIAEDEAAYSRALVLKLKNAGFHAQSVDNGEDALSIVVKDNFDLLLCDLIMPKMNGFTLLEEFKKRQIKIPVIILSNLSQSDDEIKARKLGAVDFLIKSNIQISDVVSKVQKLLV